MTEGAGFPPINPEKLKLIHAFMRASRLQAKVDSGEVVPKQARAAIWKAMTVRFEDGALGDVLFPDFVAAPGRALSQAYAPQRDEWQAQYENHLNQEYANAELEALTAFFDSPLGKHYLDGEWRMRTYIRSNMEPAVEDLQTEAEAILADPEFWRAKPEP